MSNYLYPVEINLSELTFKKPDVDIGSGKMLASHFMIPHAGVLTNFVITVDRTTALCEKTLENVEFDAPDTNTPNFFVSDSSSSAPIDSEHIPLLEDVRENSFHESFKGTTTPENLISGAIYTLMVKEIFGIDSNIDFTDADIRNNGALFIQDPTNDSSGGISSDIIEKTNDELNNDSSGSEFDYWNARTSNDASGFETNTVNFTTNDKVYILYSVSVTLTNVNVDVDSNSLTALSTFGTSDSNKTPSSLSPIRFVLGWNIQKS